MAWITFPQYITIQNVRLAQFNNFLMVSLFVAIVGRFVLTKQYTKAVEAVGYVQMDVGGHDDFPRLEEVWAEKSQMPFCTSPLVYDYWYDKAGAVRYENHTCMPLCTTGQARTGCLSNWEAFSPERADQVFLATQMQEEILQSGGGNVSKGSYLLPATEALTVQLRYTYRGPDTTVFGDEDVLTNTEYSSLNDVTTVVLDKAGAYWKEFQPGNTIVITVPDLLTLCGESLDQIQPRSGKNWLEGANHPEGALARISGMEIILKLNCYEASQGIADHVKGSICYMTVEPSMGSWQYVSKQDVVSEGGTLRNRIYHGIRVRSEVKCIFAKVDFNNIYLNISSMIILLQLPRKCILIFAVTLLGHTSRIYRRAIFRKFSIVDQCGGMAMRMMANNTAFEKLEDVHSDREEENKSGISKQRIEKQIKRILANRGNTLDRREIEQMATFCHYAAVDLANKAQKKTLKAVQDASSVSTSRSSTFSRALKRSPTGGVDESDVVNVDSFQCAVSTTEPIDFESFVDLFDRDRRRSFLEEFFMPKKLKNSLTATQAVSSRARKDQNVGKPGDIFLDDDDEDELAKEATNGSDSTPDLLSNESTGRSDSKEQARKHKLLAQLITRKEVEANYMQEAKALSSLERKLLSECRDLRDIAQNARGKALEAEVACRQLIERQEEAFALGSRLTALEDLVKGHGAGLALQGSAEPAEKPAEVESNTPAALPAAFAATAEQELQAWRLERTELRRALEAQRAEQDKLKKHIEVERIERVDFQQALDKLRAEHIEIKLRVEGAMESQQAQQSEMRRLLEDAREAQRAQQAELRRLAEVSPRSGPGLDFSPTMRGEAAFDDFAGLVALEKRKAKADRADLRPTDGFGFASASNSPSAGAGDLGQRLNAVEAKASTLSQQLRARGISEAEASRLGAASARLIALQQVRQAMSGGLAGTTPPQDKSWQDMASRAGVEVSQVASRLRAAGQEDEAQAVEALLRDLTFNLGAALRLPPAMRGLSESSIPI
mmetsp:Transcript_986/g.2389  ORF Transcript_986/g.2389 Transcript_986/m.2389 type:complete len:1008 (-) Transcript_986:65-3088(-)